MLKIGIITGSTRSGRVNPQVASWVNNISQKMGTEHHFEIVDIQEYNLPIFEGNTPAIFTEVRETENVKKWSEKINELDGFIFITPEYNRGVTPSLASAIDYLFSEFNNKAAGIVSYGSSGGGAAAQALRVILSTPKIAVVGTQPSLNLFTDFENMQTFNPAIFHQETIETMVNEVLIWSQALKAIR